MAIYIGAVLCGPELEGSPLHRLVQALRAAKDVHQEQLIDMNDGELDLVFHVPGSISRPEFEGLRTGKFSRKEKTVQIQIAVPEQVLRLPDMRPFFINSLQEAVKLGKKYFDKKQIAFSEEDHLRLIDAIASAVSQTAPPPCWNR